MKKIFLLVCVFGFTLIIISCGSKNEKKEQEDYGTPESTDTGAKVSPEEIIAQGQSLVKASDCKTCHHTTNKIIGPSHTDVAKKYDFTEANVKYLADKIIKGGSGVWGQVPMTAHADISQGDAEKMARYVLSLDGEKEH
jgi:cytochrome c